MAALSGCGGTCPQCPCGSYAKLEVKQMQQATSQSATGPYTYTANAINICTCIHTGIPDALGDSQIELLTRTLGSVAHKYSLLGSQLGIDDDDIQKLEHVEVDVSICLKKIVCEWRSEENPMLKDVIKAIRNEPIKDISLANELEKKWKIAGYIVS